MQWRKPHENERFPTHRICQGNFMNTSSRKNSYKNIFLLRKIWWSRDWMRWSTKRYPLRTRFSIWI
jgi:hypothetical protein